jgi:hypothetical protein
MSIEKQGHTEPLEVQVFGPTDWLVFQQLVQASLAGGREGAIAVFGSIAGLVGPGPGERPN